MMQLVAFGHFMRTLPLRTALTAFIIKFGYNARCRWLKKSVLYKSIEHRAELKL